MRSAAAIALLGLAAVATTAAAHAGHEHAGGLLDEAALETRGPILIVGDAGFTTENGVRYGSGTASDPFVIENWTLVGTGGHAIEIRDASATFLVRNVLADGAAGGDFRDGAHLANVAGGMVDASEFIGMGRYGVYLGDADGTGVCRTVVADNGYIGLYAHRSFNMTWLGNVAHGNYKHGLYLANGSSFNRLTQNLAYANAGDGHHSYGIYSGIGADDNVIDNNTARDNGAGIQVNLVARNVIRDNTVTANTDRGVSITQTTDSVVAGNVATDNGIRGILVAQSDRNDVSENTVSGSLRGIDLDMADANVVRRNYLQANDVGVRVVNDSRGNLVYDNLLSNPANALDDVGGNAWNVTKRDGPNVVGGAFVGGNYWSDLTDEHHDHDEDGLAESHGPYAVGIAGGGDFLPIVSAVGAPVAAFTASNERPSSRERVEFADASEAGAFPLVNWTWDFGDGSPKAYAPNATHAFLEGGDYRVLLVVRDEKGLTSAATRVIAVQNVLPVPVLAGGAPVVSNATRVRLDATPSFDPDGTVAHHEWALGDGAAATGPIVEHEYAADGHYAAGLLVVDNRLGSAHLPILVTVDTTPPATAAAVTGPPGDGGWVRGAAGLAFSAADATSGVLRTQWRAAGDAEWRAADGSVVLGDGAHDVEYRSVDRAGNEEHARSVMVRVDATPPETTYPGPAAVAPATPVALDAADATSGVRRTYYRLPGDAGWRLYAGPFTLAGLPEGPVDVVAWSEDHAGNAEPERVIALVLDATPPSVAVTSPGAVSLSAGGRHLDADAALRGLSGGVAGAPEAAVVVGTAAVRVAASDAASGLGAVRILVDGVLLAEAHGTAPSADWRAPPGPPAAHVVRVEAEDLAGNVRVVERAFWAAWAPEPAAST